MAGNEHQNITVRLLKADAKEVRRAAKSEKKLTAAWARSAILAALAEKESSCAKIAPPAVDSKSR